MALELLVFVATADNRGQWRLKTYPWIQLAYKKISGT